MISGSEILETQIMQLLSPSFVGTNAEISEVSTLSRESYLVISAASEVSPILIGDTAELNQPLPGKLISLHFRDHCIEGIVILPDGFGLGMPVIGIGFNEISRHTHIPVQTFLSMIKEINRLKYLELPSGKRFRVFMLPTEDGNITETIEISEWIELTQDWIKYSKTLRTLERNALVDFLVWFASEGIYAQAYTLLRQGYSREDAKIIHQAL